MLQILHLNAFDAAGGGGAARAAYRIHCCLEQYGSDEGIRSLLRVLDKRTDDQTVIGGPTPSSNHWLWRRVNPRRYLRAKRSFNSALPTLHSIAWPASGLAHELVNGRLLGDYDVLNLHWLGDHMLSIEEIGALQKPVVWTLHDQWPFCGAEHYADPLGSLLNEGSEERYVLGYPSWSRPPSESGPDLNRLTWLRKKRCWIQPITIVSPSTWLAGCAKRSFLMQHWPITVIPHPIDLNVWSPIERQQIGRAHV